MPKGLTEIGSFAVRVSHFSGCEKLKLVDFSKIEAEKFTIAKNAKFGHGTNGITIKLPAHIAQWDLNIDQFQNVAKILVPSAAENTLKGMEGTTAIEIAPY